LSYFLIKIWKQIVNNIIGGDNGCDFDQIMSCRYKNNDSDNKKKERESSYIVMTMNMRQ